MGRLRNMTSFLLRTRAGKAKQLVWVSTNLVGGFSKPSWKREGHIWEAVAVTNRIREMNEAAWKMLEPLGFTHADVAGASEAHCGKAEKWGAADCELAQDQSRANTGVNVHPSIPAGADFYAKVVAEAVRS